MACSSELTMDKHNGNKPVISSSFLQTYSIPSLLSTVIFIEVVNHQCYDAERCMNDDQIIIPQDQEHCRVILPVITSRLLIQVNKNTSEFVDQQVCTVSLICLYLEKPQILEEFVIYRRLIQNLIIGPRISMRLSIFPSSISNSELIPFGYLTSAAEIRSSICETDIT